MAPVNAARTFLDLASELKIPVLLIGANYLGAISHILTAAAVMKGQGVQLEGIIINQFSEPHYLERDLVGAVGNFSKVKTFTMENFLKDLATFT
jgi:dethiobiotin synthetase